MNPLRWRVLVVLLAVLLLAGRKPGPLKPEPLRPFAEFERLLLRGAAIVAAIVAIWFVAVLLRGVLQSRRQARAAQDLDKPSPSAPAADEKSESPPLGADGQ